MVEKMKSGVSYGAEKIGSVASKVKKMSGSDSDKPHKESDSHDHSKCDHPHPHHHKPKSDSKLNLSPAPVSLLTSKSFYHLQPLAEKSLLLQKDLNEHLQYKQEELARRMRKAGLEPGMPLSNSFSPSAEVKNTANTIRALKILRVKIHRLVQILVGTGKKGNSEKSMFERCPIC